MNVTFIRHAESEYNRDGIWCGRADCNLTQKGIETAKKIGEKIDRNFDIIYCSPLKRTKQTLKAILPDAKPIYDERIIEVSIGQWENTKKELYPEELKKSFRNGFYIPPGAETHRDVDKRVCSFVEELFSRYSKNANILVVTHNGVMRAIKRNFMKDMNNIMSENLATITLTEEEFQYYLKRNELER